MPGSLSRIRKVYTGDYRALERELVSRVRDLRRADALSPIIAIVTSRLLGLHLKRHLGGNGTPHVNIRFVTIEDLAWQIAAPVIYREGKTRMPGFASSMMMAETLKSAASEIREFYFSGIIDRAGFHEAMLSTIGDLEEGALSPADILRVIKKPGVSKSVHSKKLEDLAAVWDRYRRMLDETAWVGEHQVMHAAAEHLTASALVSSAMSFLFYGFYDLNALQKRFLDRCMDAKDTFAFVPFEDRRAFDFAGPTLRWMESKGFSRMPATPADNDESSPVLVHLSKNLFEDRTAAPVTQDAVAFLSAPGEVREAREIARLIAVDAERSDLQSHEVGILLRDPKYYGGLLRETFEHLKIEPYVPEGRPLSETLEGRSVLLLLEILTHDYARSEVMEFITFAPLRSNLLGKGGKAHYRVHRWDAVSVAAGIVEAKSEWEERLQRLAEEYRRPGGASEYTESPAPGDSFDKGDIDSLRRFMKKLSDLLGELERAATWTGKSEVLTKALRELLEEGPHTGRVTEAIGQLGDLDKLPSAPGRAEFIQAAGDCLDCESVRLGRFQRQGPAVVSLTAARGIPFRVVVIPGMTEKAFPPAIRQDAILLDHEREAVNKAVSGTGQLHLISKRRLDEERLLFRLAVGAARRRLLITFPRLTIGTARERLPSSFVLAAAEALSGRKAYFDTIESTMGFLRVPLAEIAVRDPEEAIDQMEFDLSTTLENIGGRTPEGILFLRRYSSFFADGLRLEAARWGKQVFTVYDGVLDGAEARRLLERDHGIVGRRVSPTALETYAACPFSYLIGNILGVESLIEPEQARTISPLDRGALVHTILWKFFTTLKKKDGPISVGRRDLALLRQIAGREFRRFEITGVVGYPVMWELERGAISTLLDDFAEEEAEPGPLHPTYFEVRYGMKTRTAEESEISTDRPVPLSFGRRTILLRGRIDRIDLSEDGRQVRIIDYKTGKPHAKEDDFQGGTTLQLPLYLHAADHILRPLHPGISELSAEYYHLAAGGKKRHIGFSGECMNRKQKELESILDTIADGIAGGLFFPLPGKQCRWCGFALACGPYRRLILKRKWRDPRAESFLQMRGEIEGDSDEGEDE